MSPLKRPSHKELTAKLSEARTVLSKQDGLFADPSKAVGELLELGIGETSETWPLVLELLNEIMPENYAGGRPPQKSYEASIEGFDLFAFSWESKKLSKRMYLKFALKNSRFYYVSVHADRPTKTEEGATT